MIPVPNFARLTRRCERCQQHKPIAGSYQTRRAGRNTFVCADCMSHARVISGTGNAREQRQLAQLIRALKS